jgi:hypothetical protein
MRRLFSASVAIVALVACSGTHYVSTRAPDAVLMADAQSPAEVRAAVVRALASRRFTTESEQAGRVVARLDKGSERLRVAVEYTGQQYAVVYLDSAGLKTKTENVEVLVESSYKSWTDKLKHAIGEELKRPAKERAEAERREREYQLLLQAQRTAEAQATAQAAEAQATAASAPAAPDPVAAPAPPPVTFQSTTTIRESQQSFTCCINGARYACPGQEAFRECVSKGPSKCTPAGRC